VDYAVWGALQEMVCRQRRFTSVDELKTAIVTEWQKLLQRFINRAINQWRRRLECVLKSVHIYQNYCKKNLAQFFLDHPVYVNAE